MQQLISVANINMLSLVLIAVIVIQLALCFGEMFQLTVLLTAYILSTSVHDFQKKSWR